MRPIPRRRHARLIAALLLVAIGPLGPRGIAASASEPVCSSGFPAKVVNGVHACVLPLPDGQAAVATVFVAPYERKGSIQRNLRALLEPAFYFCTGVPVPRDAEGSYDPGSSKPASIVRFPATSKISGARVPNQCQIELATAAYEAVETTFLQNITGMVKSLKIEIDFNGSAIRHNISKGFEGDSRFADLPECNPSRKDQFFRVTDARHWMDPLAGGGREAQITRIGPAKETTATWGRYAVRVETASNHGFSDGNDRIPASRGEFAEHPGTGQGLGDVVRIQGTSHYDGYYLVQQVVDAKIFLIKSREDPRGSLERPRQASVLSAPATAWCSGSDWQSGKPVIYMGGAPKRDLLGRSVRPQRTDFVSLRNFSYRFDGHQDRYFFQRFVVLDSRGKGVSHATIENLDSEGHSQLGGKVVVDLGGPVAFEEATCESVFVRNVRADPIGSAWSAAIWNRGCSAAVIERVHVEHGGSIWIGMDRKDDRGRRYHRPHNVHLNGHAEGINEGPGLAVWSGRGIVLSGFKGASDKDGPGLPSTKGDRGMIAVIGGHEAEPVSITTHGSYWYVHPSTDLDCYVNLGRIASWSWHGGHIEMGSPGMPGKKGKGSFACTHGLSEVKQLDWRNVHQVRAATSRAANRSPVLLDLSDRPADIGHVAPNVTDTYALSFFARGPLEASRSCLRTQAGSPAGPCGSPEKGPLTNAHSLGTARTWVHGLSCLARGASVQQGWRSDDAPGFRVIANQSGHWISLGPLRTIRARDLTDDGEFQIEVNAATPAAGGAIAVELSTPSTSGPDLELTCQLKVSDLVD
jgi:hypothetical protein